MGNHLLSDALSSQIALSEPPKLVVIIGRSAAPLSALSRNPLFQSCKVNWPRIVVSHLLDDNSLLRAMLSSQPQPLLAFCGVRDSLPLRVSCDPHGFLADEFLCHKLAFTT
jgi:hypothetical protein